MRRIAAAVGALAALCAGPANAQREPTVQKELRERFGEWAERFPAEMPSYTALETIEHVRWDRRGQQSDPATAVFRYSFRRMGEKRELAESRTSAKEEASAPEGGRANLLTAPRGGNVFGSLPHDTFDRLPLLVTRLALRNHERFRYFFVSEETDAPTDAVVVGYRQTTGNGLMEIDRKPVFPTGRAWIDPEDGRLVRIEEEISDRDTRYTIAIDNAKDEKDWLPERITVRLFEKGRLVAQNVHTYTDIRKIKE